MNVPLYSTSALLLSFPHYHKLRLISGIEDFEQRSKEKQCSDGSHKNSALQQEQIINKRANWDYNHKANIDTYLNMYRIRGRYNKHTAHTVSF